MDLSALAGRSAAPAGPSGPASPSARVPAEHVTEASFGALLERSASVPVVLVLWAPVSPASRELIATMEEVAADFDGRVAVAECDVQESPAIAQALQAMSVPAAVALIGGRPAPLFQGSATADQARDIVRQVVEVAAQAGIAGAAAPTSPDAPEGDAPLPPLHQAAFDAIEAGDYTAASEAYQRALRENPRDADAKAGLAQVGLLERTQGADLAALVAAADADGSGPDALMAAADAEVILGRPSAAFSRLLVAMREAPTAERDPLRVRLLSLFEVVGLVDPAVVAARRELASLLN